MKDQSSGGMFSRLMNPETAQPTTTEKPVVPAEDSLPSNPPAADPVIHHRQVDRSKDLKKERSLERNIDLPKDRPIVHHSFDVYEDQLHLMKMTALKRQLTRGDKVTMGDVIREALDEYFSKLDDDLKI